MNDYSDLKPLLDACLDEKNNNAREFRKACGALFDVCTIEVIAALVAENEALRGSPHFRAIQSLRQDCEALRKDAERYRWLRDSDSAGKILRDMGAKYRADSDQRIDAAMSKED